MKKEILTIMSAFICFSSFSCNDKDVSSNKNEIAFAFLGGSCYGNGMIHSSDPVRYIDFNTMESSVLCAKPNCEHKTSECVAKLVGDCPIMYNDYLYYFTSTQGVEETGNGKREYKINSKLCRVSLDSSESEDIAYFTDCKPRDYDGWMIINNTVWFTGDNMNPTPDEYGNIATSNQGGEHYICSIDLESKEYVNYGSVYDGDKEYEEASCTSSAQIRGYYNSKIMIRYEFAKSSETRGQDFRQRFTELMFEFDPQTKELKERDLQMPSYVDEDTYVYTDFDKNKTYVIDNSKTYEVTCDTGLDSFAVNNKLFVTDEDKWYDLTDLSEHSMGEYADYGVVAFYDNSYILSDGNMKFVKLTEEELLALK